MMKLDLKLWHIFALVIPFIGTFFKQEISNMIYAFSTIRSKKFVEDQSIQVMSNSGAWEDFILVCYNYSIPFRKKKGGVTVEGTDEKGNKYIEKFSFQMWKTLRTRTITSTADDAVCNTIAAIYEDAGPDVTT